MDPDLEVDTDDLRRTAAALSGTAGRVSEAAAHDPAAEMTPRWPAAEAAALAADAARHLLAALGAGLADTADGVTATAEDYAQADARAAARLRAGR